MKNIFLLIFTAFILQIPNSLNSQVLCTETITKSPDLGLTWWPLGPIGTDVYANSFVPSSTGIPAELGTWLNDFSDGGLGAIRLEIWGDTGGSGPDPNNILATSGSFLPGAITTLEYYSFPVQPGASTLMVGSTYWFVITTVGEADLGGLYGAGGHTQNSVYLDNGMFATSNDGVTFTVFDGNQEMAFEVCLEEAIAITCTETVTKEPDLGLTWWPLGPIGTDVYANSFVPSSTGIPVELGTWLNDFSDGGLGAIRLEIWGDTGGSGPDPNNVLATSGSFLPGAITTLEYYSFPVQPGASTLMVGSTYWFVITTVGEAAFGGLYGAGGHTQNSVYLDNGMFATSNDGVTFTVFDGNQEMAFEVCLEEAIAITCTETVTKEPDLGLTWWPLGPIGTDVYANSFVPSSTGIPVELGTWLNDFSDGGLGAIRLEIWGDTGGSGPDPNNVLATSGSFLPGAITTLEYYSFPVQPGASTLMVGSTYWFVITTVGEAAFGGLYGAGGHTQNSVYLDNGMFATSNDGVTFTVFDGNQEMAFEVCLEEAIAITCTETVTKEPDLGLTWWPLGPIGTDVYANSFVPSSTGIPVELGTWLNDFSDGGLGAIRLEIWGDTGGSGPDPNNVLATSGSFLPGAITTLEYYSFPVQPGASTLMVGSTYWFVITTVGEAAFGGLYGAGGHTQNSVYLDNGMFATSNDGVTFTVFDGNQEMAFEVCLMQEIPIPTIGQWGVIVLGLISMIFGVVMIKQKNLLFT